MKMWIVEVLEELFDPDLEVVEWGGNVLKVNSNKELPSQLELSRINVERFVLDRRKKRHSSTVSFSHLD